MHYKADEISKFLDQKYPFNDEYAAKLYGHPIIRNMATDIESLYLVRDENLKCIKTLEKIIARQKGIIFLGGAVALGVLVYRSDRKLKEEYKASKEASA